MFKWDTPGTVLEGRLLGFKKGKKFANNPEPSDLVMFQQSNGVQVTAGAPGVLYGKLTDPPAVPLQSIVRITYLGLANSKNSGTQYKNFKVEVDEVPGQVAPTQPIQGGVGDYDALAAKLRAHNPTGAEAQLNALAQLYPDPAVRLDALKTTLKQQGVAQ